MAEDNKDNREYSRGAGEQKKTQGYTFGISNVVTQPITQPYTSEALSLFDDEYSNELQGKDGERPDPVDCDTGLSTFISYVEGDIINYFAREIDKKRNDPAIIEFRRTLPGRVQDRCQEYRGGPRLVLKTYPTLEGVRVIDIVRELYENTQGKWKYDTIVKALYSVSRKGYPFVFKDDKGKPIRTLNCRFFHISKPIYSQTKDKKTKVTNIKAYKKEGDKKVRYQKEVKMLESCDIILEEPFFYIASGYTRQPSNIFKLKREANLPNNELSSFLYHYLVGKLSIMVKKFDQHRRDVQKRLQNDDTLTPQERELKLHNYEVEYFTAQVSVPFIFERLRGEGYHKKVKGKIYPYKRAFEEQLPRVIQGLKDIGILNDYKERKGSLGESVLYFHLNKNWYSEQKETMQREEPEATDGGYEDPEEVEYEEVE